MLIFAMWSKKNVASQLSMTRGLARLKRNTAERNHFLKNIALIVEFAELES